MSGAFRSFVEAPSPPIILPSSSLPAYQTLPSQSSITSPDLRRDEVPERNGGHTVPQASVRTAAEGRRSNRRKDKARIVERKREARRKKDIKGLKEKSSRKESLIEVMEELDEMYDEIDDLKHGLAEKDDVIEVLKMELAATRDAIQEPKTRLWKWTTLMRRS